MFCSERPSLGGDRSLETRYVGIYTDTTVFELWYPTCG